MRIRRLHLPISKQSADSFELGGHAFLASDKYAIEGQSVPFVGKLGCFGAFTIKVAFKPLNGRLSDI